MTANNLINRFYIFAYTQENSLNALNLVILTYEIMYMSDIPSRVSINEAIELAKKFDDEKSYSFVNGVLNAVAVEFDRK